MGAQIAVDNAVNDDEILSCSVTLTWRSSRRFSYAQPLPTCDLSSKELSQDVLVNEGILDAHASARVDEVVVITSLLILLFLYNLPPNVTNKLRP